MNRINLNRMTNDPSYEHYAYKPTPKPKPRRVIVVPTWFAVLIAAATVVFCIWLGWR